MLEKALTLDPMFADAVYGFADILTKEQKHQEAVTL